MGEVTNGHGFPSWGPPTRQRCLDRKLLSLRLAAGTPPPRAETRPAWPGDAPPAPHLVPQMSRQRFGVCVQGLVSMANFSAASEVAVG